MVLPKHMAHLLFLVALLVCSAVHTAAGDAGYPYQELEDWVISNGGVIRTRIGMNEQGYRGLFAKEHLKAGEYLASIPGSCIINAGSMDGNFLTPSLVVLRELFHPASRFGPYLRSMPARGDVIDACTIPANLLPLLESSWWTDFATSWQSYLAAALAGEVNTELEFTIPEMLGAANVTLDDLKYGCALSATRYVATDKRRRLIMAPIYDMANHKRQCPHYISKYDDANMFHVVAGVDVQPGDEICYSYGSMRDDYALLHYGFLPDLEDPPRLLTVDHHQFNPAVTHQELSDEPFSGSQADVEAEVARLEGILQGLLQKDSEKQDKPRRGEDGLVDMLLELQLRRRNALRSEINRLKQLSAKTEL